MIVVSVILMSAKTGQATELARMEIANTRVDGDYRDYDGKTLVGRSTEALSKGAVNRVGRVTHHPSEKVHVWNLVTKMLKSMGYGK